jgi:hypothetical protein
MRKRSLPSQRRAMLTIDVNEICGHLKPILETLLAGGSRIVRREHGWSKSQLVVVLDKRIDREEITSAFEMPDFIEWWENTDLHYAIESGLSCQICKGGIAGPLN